MKTTVLKWKTCLLAVLWAAAGTAAAQGTEKEVWIENGQRRIYGVLSRSTDGNEKQPVAIVAHGFNGTHHFSRNYFATLNALGYQCYALDFPCGSVNSRSDNNTMEMSVKDQQSDLEAVVNYFRRQPDTDASHIVLIGESQGGLVAALTAAHIPDEVCGLVLVYPALGIPDNWNSRYPQTVNIPDTTRLWGVPMGPRYFHELRGMKPFEHIGAFKKPVLIVQGDADPVVPVRDARRAAGIYGDARLHVIPGAGHGFKPAELEESLREIGRFVGGL